MSDAASVHSSLTSSYIQPLDEEEVDDTYNNTCVICMSSCRAVRYRSCGHGVACAECAVHAIATAQAERSQRGEIFGGQAVFSLNFPCPLCKETVNEIEWIVDTPSYYLVPAERAALLLPADDDLLERLEAAEALDEASSSAAAPTSSQPASFSKQLPPPPLQRLQTFDHQTPANVTPMSLCHFLDTAARDQRNVALQKSALAVLRLYLAHVCCDELSLRSSIMLDHHMPRLQHWLRPCRIAGLALCFAARVGLPGLVGDIIYGSSRSSPPPPPSHLDVTLGRHGGRPWLSPPMPFANAANLATPVLLACEHGHEECALLLLEAGADPNKCLSDGSSPLFLACQNGHHRIVQHLIKHGADIEAAADNGDTPLTAAALDNRLEIVRTLLEHGADVTAVNHDLESPLRVAMREGHEEVAKVLRVAGARERISNRGVRLLPQPCHGRLTGSRARLAPPMLTATSRGRSFSVLER